MYAAKCYVSCNGTLFSAGEIITEPMTPTEIRQLLSQGAIVKVAESSAPSAPPKGKKSEVKKHEGQKPQER